MAQLNFKDYLDRLSIQEVLQEMGYTYYAKGGKRYPTYVKTDDEGKPISGDKYVVNPRYNTAFYVGDSEKKNYNVISMIEEHPSEFKDYVAGMKPANLVNLVARRLLGQPTEVRESKIIKPTSLHPFNMEDYDIVRFDKRMVSFPKDGEEKMKNPFWSFLKDRGINSSTQRAFGDYLLLSKQKEVNDANGKPVRTFQNISFPMRIPGKDSLEDKIVGMEVRGRQKLDGTSGYKGMALGSNSSQGAWIASPNNTRLQDAKDVFVFESAYDALAFFQINNRRDNDKYTTKRLYDAVYVSSGGQLGDAQSEGIIRNSPNATFHLGFDNDKMGEAFAASFERVAKRVYNDNLPQSISIVREVPSGGQKDWNDQLKDEIAAKQTATTSDSVNEDMTKEKTVAAAVDADLDGEIDIATEGDERKTSVKR